MLASGSLEPVMHSVLEQWHEVTDKCWKAVPHAIGELFDVHTLVLWYFFFIHDPSAFAVVPPFSVWFLVPVVI